MNTQTETAVVKSRPLIEFVSCHEGIPAELESINHLYSGYVKHLKMSMTMQGFPGFPKDSGLEFDVFKLNRGLPQDGTRKRLYIKGIKGKKDVESYENDPVAMYLREQRLEREKTESERIAPEIGVVLQCGGRGERLERLEPEPLAVLSDQERPLTCLMKDIPSNKPIFLHLLNQHKGMFMDLLNNYQYFGHEVSYMIQGGIQLYQNKEKQEPHCDDHGVKTLASDGPGTFARHLDVKRAPATLVVVDGNKSGLNWPWLEPFIEGFKKCNQPVMAFVWKLDPDDLKRESERANRNGGFRRYSRVGGLTRIPDDARMYKHHFDPELDPIATFESTTETKIYVPNIEEAVEWEDREILAFCGIYLVRTKKFAEATCSSDNVPSTPCWSFNGLYRGYAQSLRMPMCLQGFQALSEPLPFLAIEIDPKQHLHGIKEDHDLEQYQDRQGQGVYRYRESLPGWNR